MALNSRVLSSLFCIIFVWSFLEISNGLQSDIVCLMSIKASLEDPYGYLKDSWKFNNNTEGFICKFTGVECWHPDENKVLNLRLSDMGFRGQFPRGIKNCTSLTGLDLSNNELSGPLPFDIAELVPSVTSLDLSSNKFSMEIPKNIVNCSYLNFLKLDNNQLTGQIPPELGLLRRMKQFSVSNNMLSGAVPDFGNASLQADSFANNKGLCGRPLKPCTTPKRGLKFDFSFKGGFVVGYVVSTVSAMTIFMSYYVACINDKKRDKKKTLSTGRTSKNEEKEADRVNQSQTQGLLQEATKKVLYLTLINSRNFFQFLASTIFFGKIYKIHEV